MAISDLARRHLRIALKGTDVGDEVGDIIDAGSGTMSDYARRRFQHLAGTRNVGDGIADQIDSGAALSDYEVNALATMLASRTIAGEIQTELSS